MNEREEPGGQKNQVNNRGWGVGQNKCVVFHDIFKKVQKSNKTASNYLCMALQPSLMI